VSARGIGMERVNSLREQARKLREIAARSTSYPEIRRRLVDLAEQCEQLADSFDHGSDSGKEPSQ
jgi:uncharacterized protein DUF6381